MNITFFGHQTWGVECQNKIVLFDPLLEPYFGASTQSFCAIYPFREVSPLSNIEAIFLSHEHADHFCVDTLKKLDKKIPIYTGVLMPNNVDYALNALGFQVKKFNSDEKIYLTNNVIVTPHHAGKDTPYWERRVYQFEVVSNKNSFFLAVDAGIAESTVSKIKNGEIQKPGLFAVSNNSQVTSLFRRAAFENERILPSLNSIKNGLVGLQIYKFLIVDYLDGIELGHIAICGGGFIKGNEDLEEQPLSQHWDIADAISDFSSSQMLTAPKPGFTYVMEENAIINCFFHDSVRLLSKTEFLEKNLPYYNDKIHPLYYPYCNTNNTPINDETRSVILDFFSTFSMTDWGNAFYMECIKLKIPPVITLRIDKEGTDSFTSFSYSLADGSFCENAADKSTILIRIYDSDFHALLKGEVEIWDISGSHISVGFPEKMQNYIVPYLYSYFGEQINQDLALSFMEKKLKGVSHAI